MSAWKGPARVAVVEFEYGGVGTDAYPDRVELVVGVLERSLLRGSSEPAEHLEAVRKIRAALDVYEDQWTKEDDHET